MKNLLSFISLALAVTLTLAHPTWAATKKKKVVSGAETTVDLSAMDSPEPAVSSVKTAAASSAATVPANPHGGGGGTDPHFSIFFDLLLAYQPGKANFSFLNFHPLLLMEIMPAENLQFSFEVNPSPRYYELDYQAAKWLQLRAGKIWIPFDDMSPHNLFGGMIGTSRMRLGNYGYLPDIWADLGAGAKFTIIDDNSLTLLAHLYVVNGFGDTGSTGPAGAQNYPSFNDISASSVDKNNDKSVGARVSALISRTLNIGVSAYTNRWTPETVSDKRINMVGIDAQLRFPRTEFRLGASYGNVQLMEGNQFGRHGEYFEFMQKFGSNDQWRFMARIGNVDPDDRLVDENDTMYLGGGIRWRPGLIQWALEHYQDLKQVDGKRGYSFTGLRTIIQL